MGRAPKYVPLATLFEAAEVWLSNIKAAREIGDDLVEPCRRLSFQFPGITSKDWAIAVICLIYIGNYMVYRRTFSEEAL
ncbi:hypothetical protein CEE34_05050 [Candidatus Aerophobetes bacterium Ae_b3a]|nr:MAG: hypothetical protein CEE34_05050 [Candidatus Aerophobetes bacterium Ae_b3a]